METRELRLAPVMTGGTSLAVWMGGVTAELYRVLCSDPAADEGTVYARLLRLTATRPVVDVVTGTSAGGLNGTLLAAALRLGVSPDDFLALRDTWMEVADLRLLLRSPHERNPASLLHGDDYFTPNVLGRIRAWERADRARTPVIDLDLVTTVTTLAPEPRHRTDDFDEPISEVSHAQCLRFVRTDFEADDWPEKLAVAARTSASIPGVFEPSFLPSGPADAADSRRPDFEPNASFDGSRWAVDGGVVVNLPLTEALDRIFDRRASVEVKRVVLYVSPTPPAPMAPEPGRLDAPPTIRAAVTSIVTAPRAEGVATDIDVLRARNAAFERQALARRHLKPTVDLVQVESGLPPEQQRVFATYRERRSTESVHDTVGAIRRALARTPPEQDLRVGLSAHRHALFPASAAVFSGCDRSWAWGIRSVEQAISIAKRLLSTCRTVLPDPAPAVGEAQQVVYDALAVVNDIRKVDDAYWKGRYGELSATRPEDHDLVAWAARSYDEWLRVERPTAFDELRDAHAAVASALLLAREALVAAVEAEDHDLAAELDLLQLRECIVPTVEALQRRLLAVHVAQTVLLGEVLDREQPIELMQISSNSRNLLCDKTSDQKLAGPELGRLGAFLKPSWRANDWMWGRLDGAYRLVVLLADPRRIRQLHPTRAAARAAVTTACGGTLPDDVAAELDALYAPDRPLPRSLPALAGHLAAELQREIAAEELPNVAAAIEASTGNETATLPFLRAYARAVDTSSTAERVPPESTPALLEVLAIGDETVGTELGYSSLNRVTVRGASVALNALTGSRAGIPLLPRLLRPLRAPLQAVASVATLLVDSSPLARAGVAFLLAVAGAIVSLELVGVDVPTGTFTISAVLLTGLLVTAMLRSGFWMLATCVLLGAAVIGLTLAGSGLETVVYGPAPGDEPPAEEPDPVDVEAGSTLHLEGGAVLEVRSGEAAGERIDTIELPEDGTVVLRSPATLTAGGAARSQGWKRWGFANPDGVSVFQVLAVLVSGLLVARSVRRGRRSILRHAGAVVLVLAAVFARDVFEPVLTGERGDSAVKDWFVDTAKALEDYDLEVVLLVLVGASVLLALGSDLVVQRQARRVRLALAERRSRV